MTANYCNTQRGPWHYLLFLLGTITIVVAWSTPAHVAISVLLVVVAFIFFGVGCLFGQMTVSDEFDHLLITFGPIPLIRKRVDYASIVECRVARSSLIDGWGIHGFPGRGWTFNIWGFDCVECQTQSGMIRIGTNDPAKPGGDDRV